MRTLFLIDANSLIHRAFHALPPFTAPTGEPTGALYGLASILLKLLREERLEYAAALFDRPEPTFREKEYGEYKAQRPKAPDELVRQIIGARELFSRFGIAVFEEPGFEADDLIAALVAKFRAAPDTRIVIVTGDLDTLQLVEGERVVVRSLKKGVSDTVTYDEQAVLARYGLKPRELLDYKAMVGDPSDNIKGVPGIGPKTARALVEQFGSLENIYRNAESDEKLGKKLGPWRKEAELARRLVALRADAPIGAERLEDLRVAPDRGELVRYFERLGFETLVKRFSEVVSFKKSLFPADP